MVVNLEARTQSRRHRFASALKASAGRLFREVRTILHALTHPGVPWYAKFVCVCAILYVASPIQLIPNFLPVIGQLDDVLVISLSIRFLRRSVPAAVLSECQNAFRPRRMLRSRSGVQVTPVQLLRPNDSPSS